MTGFYTFLFYSPQNFSLHIPSQQPCIRTRYIKYTKQGVTTFDEMGQKESVKVTRQCTYTKFACTFDGSKCCSSLLASPVRQSFHCRNWRSFGKSARKVALSPSRSQSYSFRLGIVLVSTSFLWPCCTGTRRKQRPEDHSG